MHLLSLFLCSENSLTNIYSHWDPIWISYKTMHNPKSQEIRWYLAVVGIKNVELRKSCRRTDNFNDGKLMSSSEEVAVSESPHCSITENDISGPPLMIYDNGFVHQMFVVPTHESQIS